MSSKTASILSYTPILLHPFCADECAADRAALPQIIDGLRARGLEPVTVAELLEGTR